MPSGSGFLDRTFSGTAPHGAVPRIVRGAGAGIWLVYLASPLRAAYGHGHNPGYTAGAIGLAAAFAVIYLWVIVMWVPARTGRPRPARTAFVVLFAIALAASIVYGTAGIVMWIFVSSAASWTIADDRLALRVIAVTTACYLVLGVTSHLGIRDYLFILLLVVLVGVSGLGFRRRIVLTRQLTQARDEIEQMAAAAERLRLSRDMHDLTGQSLSTITLKSELAARLVSRLPAGPERDRVRDEIEQVAEVSRQTLSDIRQALSGYRRPTLAVEAITARGALESAGIRPHDDAALTVVSGTLDPDAEAALAWCLREAVTNVVRHSGARNCHISLTRHPDSVSLGVRDDGRGLAGDGPGDECAVRTPTGVSTAHSLGAEGTGLRGMSERLAAVGGRLELRPSDGGLALTATVPAADRVTVSS